MEDGPLFGVVDLGAGVHLLGFGGYVAFLGQGVEELHGFVRDAIFGVVHEEVFEFEGEVGEAGWVGGEEVADVKGGGGGMVGC